MVGKKPPATPHPEPTELDKAWAAGFFDGEGSTTATKNGNIREGIPLRYIRLQLSQSRGEKDLVVKIQSILGGSVTNRPSNPDKWVWVLIGHHNCVRALKWMWPYLGSYKKTQARKALMQCRNPRVD